METPEQLPEIPVDAPSPAWCVVGNIVLERPYGLGGEETRAGTRKFRPGAKVVCGLCRWGGTETRLLVIGRDRATNRYITTYIRGEWLTNARLELIRSPAIIERIHRCYENKDLSQSIFDGSEENRLWAEGLLTYLKETYGDSQTQPYNSTRVSNLAPCAETDGDGDDGPQDARQSSS